jgi:alpha-tubulin suppressor-like RCC1 family protein
MCGNGERGQLGLRIVTKKEYKPLKVEFKDENGRSYSTTPKFKQVSCGYFHTGFLTGKFEYLMICFL